MSKRESDAKRTHTPERVSMETINGFPALLDTEQYASIIGQTPLYVAKMCRDGKLPAVRCGRTWRINKAKALAALDLA